MTRSALISTVGTSLLEGNVKRLSDEAPGAPENWCELRGAYKEGSWKALAGELLKIPPEERVMGAEINTVEEARKKSWLSLEKLVFLVSDTPNGENTGEVLKEYFERREDLGVSSVEYAVVEELQDERPSDFRVHGLRNLVRAAGDCIQRLGGPEQVAFDATGGYKAQIAVAVLLGQALDVPVFYKHERFSEIIDFLPLPISFDYEILAQNTELLTDLERGRALSSGEAEIDERLRALLDEVTLEGQTLYELSPIGQIYLTGFRLRNPKPVNLTPAEHKEQPHFAGDHHYPMGFKEFVERVWRENQWIVTASSLPYGGQKAIKGTGFHVSESYDPPRLIGTFEDKNNFGGRFLLDITDGSFRALTWAAHKLNEKYRQ